MGCHALIRSIRLAASFSALLAGAGPALAQPQAQVPPAPPGVSAQALSALDLWSTPGRDTGLPTELWRGASPALVGRVLAQVGERPPSPAIAAMARRLLATGARAPEGGGGDPTLAALRARALILLGDADAALAALARTPGVEASEPLSRARAEAALITGHDGVACDTAQALEENRDHAWWRKLRIYCAIRAGQGHAAQVALDLWRQGGGKDPTFERLASAAAGGAAGNGPGSAADAVDFALSRRLNLDLGPAMASAAPAIVAAVATAPDAPPPARQAATARAVRLGVISGEAARAAYASPAPAGQPSASPGERPGEAGLAQIALRGPDPVARERAAAALLDRARYAGEFAGLAELLAPALPEIARAGVPLSNPVQFEAAAAAAGDTATADLVRGRIEQDRTPGAGPADLALLDALIAAGSARAAGPVADRLAERANSTAAPLQRQSALGAALILAALGQPLSPAARAEIAGLDLPASKAAPTRLLLMSRDAADGRPGETAMLALSIGLDQPSGPTLSDRIAMIEALRVAGLPAEARRLAIESLLILQRAAP